MNKFLFTLNFIFFACASFVISQSDAQDKKNSTLTTAIIVEKAEDVSMDSAVAKLLKNGTLVSTIVTKADGVVTFNLEPNSDYTIEISKQGYVSKIISINTKVPDYETKAYEVAFSILLFIPCPGLDYSVLKDPVVRLEYNDLRGDFLPEKKYDEIMGSKMQILLEKNQKCKDDIFNNQVKKADNLFSVKKYKEAREIYVIAQNMRPENEYVKNKIAEIDKLLADQQANEKLYNDYIAQADKQFNDKKYSFAKDIYKRALTIKPGAEYPTSQIAAIDKILAQQNQAEQEKQAQEAKFQNLVDQADAGIDNDVCGKSYLFIVRH